MVRLFINIKNILIFILLFSLLSLYFNTGYIYLFSNIVAYLASGLDKILLLSFILTFIYQFGSQVLRLNSRIYYAFIYLVFILSLIIPLTAASETKDPSLALQFISYIVLNITSIPPIISLILLVTKDQGYKNPLKPIMLFSVALVNILVLEVAYNLEVESLGGFDVGRLGIYELNVFLSYYRGIASFITGLPYDEQSLKVITSIQNNSYYSILPIVLLASFIYAIATITENKRVYENELYYNGKLLVGEDARFYSRLATVSLAGVCISISLLWIIQYLFSNIDPNYSIFLLIIPPISVFLIMTLGRK